MNPLKRLINRLKPPTRLSNEAMLERLNDPDFKLTRLEMNFDVKKLEEAGKLNDAEDFTDERWERLLASCRATANGGTTVTSCRMKGGYKIGAVITPTKVRTFGVKRFIMFQLIHWVKTFGKDGWNPKDTFDTAKSYAFKKDYRQGIRRTFHKYLWSQLPKLEGN